MEKTIGDYRETIKYLSVKKLDTIKRNTVLGCVHNIEKMIVNGLPAETKLPKEAEEHLRELELLAME